ncbi:MAG: nicotinate-nucleotide adenylyltransferase [Symbiobacteriia bacterium]
MSGQRLGILGGTFDPVHIGHLALAEAARAAFALDQVVFIPVAAPPHKGAAPAAAAEHRLAMVQLAVGGNPGFAVSSMELERPGPSYTVDTLVELRRRHPGASLFFIVGADEILDLSVTWREPRRVLELAEFIAATRPGFDLERLHEALAPLGEGAEARIHPLPWLHLGVSASALRERLAAGKTVRYLVPDPVLAYMQRHHLYGW